MRWEKRGGRRILETSSRLWREGIESLVNIAFFEWKWKTFEECKGGWERSPLRYPCQDLFDGGCACAC